MRCMMHLLLAGAVLASAAMACHKSDDDAPMKKPVSITGEPTTVQVELGEDNESRIRIAKAVDHQETPTVRLRLRGIEVPQDVVDLKSLRIFIADRSVSLKTPIKNPHYAGSLVLDPLQRRQNITLNIGETIANLTRRGQLDLRKQASLDITFVPVPYDTRSPTLEHFRLNIESVELNVPAGIENH